MKLILLALSVTFVFSGVQNLELRQAIDMLKKNNSQLEIAKLDVLIKQYDKSVAFANHFGKLDIEMNAINSNSPLNAFGFKLQNRKIKDTDFSPDKLNNPDDATHYKLRLSYKLPIYMGGKINAYGNIATSMHKLSKLDKENILNEKIFQAKEVFYNISFIGHYIDNLAIILKNMKKLQKTTSSMKKEGYAKNTDILEIKSRISKVKNMHDKGISDREIMYKFLSFLLNDEITSIKIIDNPQAIQIKKVDIDNIIDIQKAKQGLKIQEASSDIEFANFLPQVGFFANMDLEENEMSTLFDAKESYSVGIQVKVNIFNGNMDRVKYQQAKIKNLQALEKLKLAKKGTLLKINKLKAIIIHSKNDIKSLDDRRRLSQEISNSYKAKYKEGLVSISDVLIRQSEEIEVLLQLLGAKSTYNSSILKLNYIANKENK